MTRVANYRWFQFRLRTLFIVLGLATIPLSRVAYLHQQAEFHDHEVHRFYSQLKVPSKREDWTQDTYNCLDSIGYHVIMRERFREAVYRPWTIVEDTVPPPLGETGKKKETGEKR